MLCNRASCCLHVFIKKNCRFDTPHVQHMMMNVALVCLLTISCRTGTEYFHFHSSITFFENYILVLMLIGLSRQHVIRNKNMHLKYDHRTTLLGLMSIVHLQFLEEKNRTCFISSCTCIAILQLCLRKVAINYTVNIMILFHGYVLQ